METGRILIVGASLAGLTAAEALRAEGFAGELLVIGDELEGPYSRPPLSKQVLLGDWPDERTTLRTTNELDALGVRVLTGTRAVQLDVTGHRVRTATAWIPYDVVILATGVSARRPAVEVEGRSFLTLRTRDDAKALREAIAGAGRIVVLGTGVLGSEVASAARKADRRAAMVGRSPLLSFGSVGRLLHSRLAALHRSHGVDLRLPGTVDDLEPSASDALVAAIGGVPNASWLRGSGVSISDGVLCDAFGLAAPGVYAIGDVAAWTDPLTGTATRVEHQTSAIEQAYAVAHMIVTGEGTPASAPFFWSEIHGVRIQSYGTFDQGAPLVGLDGDDETGADVLASVRDGRISGVVGWNAPRQFREARGRVDLARAQTIARHS